MTIYTRRGDDGETSLASGDRIAKYDPRIMAIGAIDEANCAVGLARAADTAGTLDELFDFVQQRLSNCAASVAIPPRAQDEHSVGVSDADVAFLEHTIEALDEKVGAMRGFVLPGGNELAARSHVARAAIRRAERHVAALLPDGGADARVATFLNRLSDVLFCAARVALAQAGIAEEEWDPDAPPPRL